MEDLDEKFNDIVRKAYEGENFPYIVKYRIAKKRNRNGRKIIQIEFEDVTCENCYYENKACFPHGWGSFSNLPNCPQYKKEVNRNE